MTDDKIIEAVARAMYEARLATALWKWGLPEWNQLKTKDPKEADAYRDDARAAIEAHKAALAEDGFVIHRFHDWVYPDPYPLCNALCPPPHCRRCDIPMGGPLDAASCVPGEAATDRKERE